MTSTKDRARVLTVTVFVSGWLMSCSAGGEPSPKAAAVATPNSTAAKYVALIRDYWIHYVAPRADGAVVCWDARAVDPAKCRDRAAAILVVNQKFLSDLDITPPPPTFATDDQIFRGQLPKAIAQVKVMISAAESGDKQAVIQATTAYVDDMIPPVTSSLDHVDPSVIHR
jgi:hypothetical protein